LDINFKKEGGKMGKIKLAAGMMLLGFVAATGATIGFLLGLLLSRKETREKILTKASSVEEKIKAKIEEAKPKISESVERGRRAAITCLEKAKERVDKYAEAIQASLKVEKPTEKAPGGAD
jgi:gas vesicle protein